MKFIETGNAPIKAWIDGVQVEEKALQQLSNLTPYTSASCLH
jgi:hypothetical protein